MCIADDNQNSAVRHFGHEINKNSPAMYLRMHVYLFQSVSTLRWLYRATNTVIKNFQTSIVETSILVTSVLTLTAI